jgi:hypothetical protein
MVLRLAGRNPARFEFDDGVSQTTVTVQPDDDADTVRAKLQRVLELEGGPQPALVFPPGVRAPAAPGAPVFTPADRAAENARLASVQTSGWTEDADFDNLPEK